MGDFHRIRPCNDSRNAPQEKDRGWRIRLTRFEDDIARLVEEQVLPEKVERVDAHRIVAKSGDISLTTEEVRWLRDSLSELLAVMEADEAPGFEGK
jgi:hypothetical protein